MIAKETHEIAAEELVACQAAVFEWAESFDSKDWTRLAECIAPTLYVDYRAVMGMIWETMPAADFVNLVTAPAFLGNPSIKTQHFIGATKWVKTSQSEIIGHHQMRVAHQRYKNADLKEVLHRGHAHGKATIHYCFVDGTWKFAGLVPEIRWSEHEYEKIFREE